MSEPVKPEVVINPNILRLEWATETPTPVTHAKLIISVGKDGRTHGMEWSSAAGGSPESCALAAYRFGLRQPFKAEDKPAMRGT